jgi:ubiquinone/menaquinone biosynthesis C-methylase UbiE
MLNLKHSPEPPRAGLRKRLFAYMTAHSGSEFNLAMAERKRDLLGSLHGTVLEIGPGDGTNLMYYPTDVHWIGVEPNPFMQNYLQETIHQLNWPSGRYQIDSGDPKGIRLPAGDASVDAVAGTLVLCSVPDPAATLAEILRVLKPGGRYAFIEHVAAPQGTSLRFFQNVIQPVWSLLGDSCHPNRETWSLISKAGFAHVEIEHFHYHGAGPIAPLIAGIAIKEK